MEKAQIPILRLGYCPFSHRPMVEIPDHLRPLGKPSRQSSNPFLLVQSANPAATLYFYLTAGEQEALL